MLVIGIDLTGWLPRHSLQLVTKKFRAFLANYFWLIDLAFLNFGRQKQHLVRISCQVLLML